MWKWGNREIVYRLLHCHQQNDSCIMTSSDERHFNVSLIEGDRSQLLKRKESRSGVEPEVPLLTSLTARPNQLTLE